MTATELSNAPLAVLLNIDQYATWVQPDGRELTVWIRDGFLHVEIDDARSDSVIRLADIRVEHA